MATIKKTKNEMLIRKKIITIWYNYSREQFLVFFILSPNFIKKFFDEGGLCKLFENDHWFKNWC